LIGTRRTVVSFIAPLTESRRRIFTLRGTSEMMPRRFQRTDDV